MTNLKTVSMGVLDRQLTNKEAWTTFWACFLYGFTTSFMCFKVSSPLLAIAEEFSIAEGDIGMVMTTFAIAALVLAYPGTWFMRNVGVKFTVIVTALFSLAGTVLGCVATTYEIFMFSRVLEGIGYGMFAAMGANICTRIFPTSKLGLVMGTWSLWMPVGSTFAFVASPLIFEALGWRAIWVFCAILEIVSIAAVLFLMKMPAKSEADLVEGDPAKERRKTKNFFFAAIMVQVAFTAWCFLYLVNINSLYPAYLQQIKGLSVMDSSMLPTILAVITIVFGVFAGILADKTRQRKWMLVIAYIAVAINFAFFVFTEDPANMASPWIAMVIMGLCGAFMPMCTRSIVPVLCPDQGKTDYALATMAFVTAVAQFGGVIASQSATTLGWATHGLVVCMPIALVAAVIILVFVKSEKQVLQEQAAFEAAAEPAE